MFGYENYADDCLVFLPLHHCQGTGDTLLEDEAGS